MIMDGKTIFTDDAAVLIKSNTSAKTATFTAASGVDTYLVTPAAAVTVTLPATLVAVAGYRLTIKDCGAATTYNITVATEGSTAKIDGADTAVLSNNYASITLVSNGTHWFVEQLSKEA